MKINLSKRYVDEQISQAVARVLESYGT